MRKLFSKLVKIFESEVVSYEVQVKKRTFESNKSYSSFTLNEVYKNGKTKPAYIWYTSNSESYLQSYYSKSVNVYEVECDICIRYRDEYKKFIKEGNTYKDKEIVLVVDGRGHGGGKIKPIAYSYYDKGELFKRRSSSISSNMCKDRESLETLIKSRTIKEIEIFEIDNLGEL